MWGIPHQQKQQQLDQIGLGTREGAPREMGDMGEPAGSKNIAHVGYLSSQVREAPETNFQ